MDVYKKNPKKNKMRFQKLTFNCYKKLIFLSPRLKLVKEKIDISHKEMDLNKIDLSQSQYLNGSL